MKGALNLGRVFGIRVQIHWTFVFLIGWVVFMELSRGGDFNSVILYIGFVLAIFGCVVLHELGHALTAKRYGINTRKITLLPIGGVASLERMPEEPKKEFMVAIAGPAVNVVIALLLYSIVPVDNFISQDPEVLEQTLSHVTPNNFLFYLLTANLMLVVFNAIPAFPMDGGRVLRALLSMRMDRVKATQVAATLGQMVAVAFFFIGLLYNPILILIALFVFFGAQSENLMVRQLAMLRGHKVKEAMMTNISVVHPEDSLGKLINILLSGSERQFVVAKDGQVQGIVSQSILTKSLQEHNREVQVNQIMSPEFDTVGPDDDLIDIYKKARIDRNAFIPVVDNGKLVGVIDMNNINEFMMVRSSLDY